MVEHRIKARRQKFDRLSPPKQERSRARRQEILTTTALLLEQVGFDDLTTILIAREVGISVGTLYHYFPNKQAILHAIGEEWLQEYSAALQDFSEMPLETLDIAAFSTQATKRLVSVYQTQRGMLPLVQAMYSVPELRDLDEAHDESVISAMSGIFARLGLKASRQERRRLARMWMELTHALLISVVEQKPAHRRKSLDDLIALTRQLLTRE